MEIKRTHEMQFADGLFSVEFTLTRHISEDKEYCRYWLDAVTPTGFDLTTSSYGVLNSSFTANKRLKAEKSILNEMNKLLDSIIEYASTNLKRFILNTLTVKHTLDKSEWQFFKETNPFPTCSIKSKESGHPIAWYYHDVFNTETEIEITFIRNKEGQLQAFANETSLYNIGKLKALAERKEFKEHKFAFFFYNEVKRLLGESFEGQPAAMSGLFA